LLKAAMEKARQDFSPIQFQIFDLNVVKEWPAAEVAKALGVSIASVYLAKHRVSAALKKDIARLESKIANREEA
jgi:RNA polymerase sigma-70 factor (ECF subfamily)